MKALFLILSTMIASNAVAADKELGLKQQFEQTKNAAYSKWTEEDRAKIKDFFSNVVHVFASKIVNERTAQLAGLTLDTEVPDRAALKDVISVGYMKAVEMTPVSNQKNVTFSGKNQFMCKIIAEPTYLGLQINLKADCVQSGAQWDLFEVRGKATIKDMKALDQPDFLQGVFDISNFQILTSAK